MNQISLIQLNNGSWHDPDVVDRLMHYFEEFRILNKGPFFGLIRMCNDKDHCLSDEEITFLRECNLLDEHNEPRQEIKDFLLSAHPLKECDGDRTLVGIEWPTKVKPTRDEVLKGLDRAARMAGYHV